MSPAVSLPTLEQIFTVSLQFSTNSPYRPIPGVCVCVCVYHCMVSHDVTISSVTSSLFLDVHVPYLTSKKSDDAGELLYSVYI